MSAYRDFTDQERDWQSVSMSKDSQRPAPLARKPFRQSSRSKGRQDLIGRELRRLFSDVVNEPLPDAFQDLLRQIDEEPSAGPEPKDEKRQQVNGGEKSRK